MSLVVALALPLFGQTEVVHRDDFQSYKTPSNPPGWVDTSIGNPKPEASGLYKAWNDPLQGNQGTNVVYGTKQASGKPEGNNPRIGTFSTLTTKKFDAKGRFEYAGRILRTNTDSRIGLTFLSAYPETDKYYLLGLWSQNNTTKLTMQLFAFGAGTLQGTVDSNLTIDPNKWYRFLIQVDNVDNATKIRARFWPDGTTEPTTFPIDAADTATTRLTNGRIGMWAAVKGDAYIDDISAKSPVDHTAPTITFVDAATQRTLDPAQLALFQAPARIEIRVTDDLSTVTYTAKLDATTDYTSATPITADGLHKLTVNAVDAPGNTTTASLDLLVDQLPPAVTLHIDGTPFAQGAIFNKDVTLNALIQDISTVTTTATLNGAAVTLPQPIAEERVHNISVTATDQVGRQTTVASSFLVDKTAPVITILANGVELGGGESFQDDVTLTWSANDLTFDRIEATLNGAPITTNTKVTQERTHDLVVKAYDKAGHSTTETRKFILDKTAPEVRVLANGDTFKPGTTFNAPVTFTVEANDSTPTTSTATLDNQPYTLGTAAGGEGTHMITIVVTDSGGLATTVGPAQFTIDLTPPSISLKESGEPFRDGMKFNRDVSPVVAATDNLTATPLRELFLDGREFPLDTPIAEEKADHVLIAKATDDGGNSTSAGPFHFILDKTRPVVTIVEETTGKPFGDDALFARPVRVKITVADLTATTIAATLNGAAFDPSGSVTADGTWTVSVVATDAVGWQNEPVTATFTIDQTPPHLTFTSHADHAVVSTPTVVLAGNADDAISISIAGAQATLDLAAKTFTSEPVALVEGMNKVTATAKDKAGNTRVAELSLELDTRAPEIIIDTPATGACIDAATLTVTGTVSDPRVESVKVNDVPATLTGDAFTATIPVDEGPQLLTLVAADSLGHLTTITRSVLVDRTAPAIEVRESGAPFTGTLFNRAITLLVRAIDADPNTQLTATLDGAPYASGTSIDAEGAHALEVTATDCAGHRTTQTFAFTIDRTPPSLANLNPANGATVGTLPTAIAGTADNDTATIELLGTDITTTPVPAFTLNGVPFAEGTNHFVLRATDRAGNSAQLDYTVTVKTAAPVITILEGGAPLPSNAIFTRAITPEIKADDATATLTATLNGAPYTSRTEIAADGSYTLKATAIDSLSHTGTLEVFFTIDRTAPSVRITFPQSGNVAAETVEVRGVATNAETADVNGAAVTLDANGAFVLPMLHLEFGTTRIVATARDRAGNTGTAEIEVTRDDVRPGILLTYPPDRAVTNRPTTEVLGRVLSPSPDGVVTIGTRTTPVDPLGAFRLSGYPLVEGDNTITASTKTNNGATNSASVVVTADFTPPALAILEHGQPLNDAARFASEAVLSLQTSDNRGGETSELTVDGVKAAALPLTVTATGGHAAVAVARDQAGNETRVERTFFIGATGGGSATCAFDGLDPADQSIVLTASTTLLGRTTAAGVKVQDIAANVADGSFRATVELPQEGANHFTLRCTDGAGVAFGDAVSITLNRVTGDPSIEIASPSEGFVTADETITVTGTVGPGVVSADVNGATAAIAGNDPSTARPFTVAGVRLAGGLNILVARGRNAAGRVATASRRVTALRDQPSLAITSPLSGAVTGAAKIELAGTFADLDPATITVTNLATNSNAAVQTSRTSDTTGTFAAAEVALVSGEQTVRVTARDQANRTATASVTVRLTAGAPSIAITSPANNTYFGAGASTFTVSGTFSAAAGATVDVGGTAATINGSAFTASAPFTAIGNNTTVVARVTEPGGASAVDTVTVAKLAGAPKVLESFPAPNAVEVDAGAALLVLFSAPMDRASLAGGAFRLEDPSGAAVSGTILLDKDVLTFAPAALLTRGARYTLRVTTAAKDLAGTAVESEWLAPFTIGTSAPSTPPALTPVSEAFCGQTLAIKGTATAGARLQLTAGTLALTATADAQGNFTFDYPLSGQSGYALVRVRIIGSDGSLSPAAELTFRVDCVGPQVLNATYDRTGANRLTIDFSEPVEIPAGAIYVTLTDGRTVAVSNGIPAEDLTARSFTLNVTTAVRDPLGNRLAAPYTQTFTLGTEQPSAGDGSGFISGEIYDATTGRPLAGATVTVEVPSPGPLASSPAVAQVDASPAPRRRDAAASAAETAAVQGAAEATAFGPLASSPADVAASRAATRAGGGNLATTATTALTSLSDPRGRYLLRLPEGAHTIRATMPGYTSVWRQIIVPAGAGVVPIDIRLTKQGDPGGETKVTRPVTLTGSTAKLTAIGAQALTGLLPLGWSPLTAAEVAGDVTNATLTFTVPAADVTAAAQTLTAVRYDELRDEWTVLAAVVNITNDKVTLPITTGGAYALVYADKAPGLQQPPLAQTGAVLAGVPAPAATTPLVSRAFTLDPPIVLPNGRTVAALQIEGLTPNNFPSGTAVQAYIDEELRLADGSRLLDPPFATDLLLYRNLAGTLGTADFHLAPSPRAAQVILEVGFDHIRVVPYPGRLDRGTLIGNEGGRIPGDDKVAVDIPAGATPEPVKATAVSLTQQDLDSIGTIQGFKVLGGFTLTLQRATPAQAPDLDHDGQPDAEVPNVELFKPARATFTLNSQFSILNSQFILVELLDQSPYGKIARLANQIERLTEVRATTTTIDRSQIPLDGITHEGRYLLLSADNPIAFATGVTRFGNSLLADARITANNLGVADLTRAGGIYNIPIPAAPAAPFSLTPRHTTTGDGAAYTHASSPAQDAIVRVDLTLTPQPPTLTAVTVFAGNPPAQITLGDTIANNVSLSTSVRATFSPAIDPASVTATSIVVLDADTGIAVNGNAVADGTVAVNWSLTPGTTLKAGGRYTVAISSGIKAPGGAQLANAAAYSFTTAEIILNAEVHTERVSITIPDANGVSRVTGSAGALPANWQAVTVRRGRDFVTRYQTTATNDGSFTFLIGNGPDATDRVTMSDLIDLRVVNNAGNLAAIIPLTPFVTEDRRGFVVPAGKAAKFVTADNITVDVPEGAFEQATLVTAAPTAKQTFDDIPELDHDVNFATAVTLDFEGRARKAIELELPVPSGMDTANRDFILALKGNSVRGPRLFAVDTLRVADGKFTTRAAASQSARSIAANQTVTGDDAKQYLFHARQAGNYGAVDIRGSAGWATLSGLQGTPELHNSSLGAFYTPYYYPAEHSTLAIPIVKNVFFTIVGYDATTSLESFRKAYDPISLGDPGVSVLPAPQLNEGGPYPVFGSPFRVDQVVLNVENVDIRSARNFVVRLSNNLVHITPSIDDPLPADTRVQALNVDNGQYQDSTAGSVLILSAKRGDRIVLLVEQLDADPASPINIVFNEPIFLAKKTPEEIDQELRSQIKLLKAAVPTNPTASPAWIDITDQAFFTADSGARRISIALSSSLPRDMLYRVILSRLIADRGGIGGNPGLTLGQGAEIQNGNAVGIGGGNELRLEFRTRNPGGKLGAFNLPGTGASRDLALNGNVLLVAASSAGLIAYDTADPAALNGPNVAPLGTAKQEGFDNWAVATDHHGRIYTATLGQTTGVLWAYRLEQFLAGGPSYPKPIAGTITNWRPGFSSVLTGTVFLSDRPEGFPRKLQLAVQDDEEEYETRQAFIDGAKAASVKTYDDGMMALQLAVAYNGSNSYVVQRVTVENETLDMRWSVDVTPLHSGLIQNILAGPGDRIRVLRNRTTYGFISLIGAGLAVFDLNAIESNNSPDRPAGSAKMAEKIELMRGKHAPGCTVPQNEYIPDITVSADAAVHVRRGQFASTNELIAYAPDPYRGLLDVRFIPPGSDAPNPGCDKRGPHGLFLRGVDPANDHPRIKDLKLLYSFVTGGRQPYPHFFSVANYTWSLKAADNPYGERRSIPNDDVKRDYVLVAGGDFGLLVVEVDGYPRPLPFHYIPYFPLHPYHLADIIWVPDGALAVRAIPGSDFAVVVSRAGRVHLVDLSRIDERFNDQGFVRPLTDLFPTAKAAILGPQQFPEGVGSADPRIIWSSEANLVQGVLPPVVDPTTGLLYGGEMAGTAMKAVAAIDPQIRMKVDLGETGLSEVGGVVPLGIDPPQKLLDQIDQLPSCGGPTPRCKENASLAAFRIEVALPGGIARALTASNNELRIAVESERVSGAPTEQTPAGPRAHLRQARRDASADPRPATGFRMQRVVPNDPALEQALRYQRGFNRFISPWIVAVADPRASAQYLWPASATAKDKADAGCNACERPLSLRNRTEAQGVFELFTNGRLIVARPEVVSAGKTIFDPTPYAYLGKNNRLVGRFATIMADTLRTPEVRAAGQNPPVAEGAIQDTVLLHSGELVTAAVDLRPGGRAGVDVLFDRTYRSRTIGGTALGQGWESSSFRRLRLLPNGDVELRDAAGEIWLFTDYDPQTGLWKSPKGFFMTLSRSPAGGWLLLDQMWRITAFDDLGRLSYETDQFYDPVAVAAGTNSGNAIRYLYDDSGHLAQIVDPIDRATELSYWNDSDASTPGAYPGLLKEVRDWRQRTTSYEYDKLGRLTKVSDPEVAADPDVPADYSFTGAKRPHTEYVYETISAPAPSATPSQAFDDYLEFAGNLKRVIEPDQASTGTARVTFGYGDPKAYPRDRLETQTWATGETVTFTHATPTEVLSTDALGQRRAYKLTARTAHDKRPHIAETRVSSVDVIAPGSINGPVDVSLKHSATDLVTTYAYNDEGLYTVVEQPNGLKVTNAWKYPSTPSDDNHNTSIAPGMLLVNSVTDGPFLLNSIHSDVRYDKTGKNGVAATPQTIGLSDTGTVTYRDAQSPSRGRKTTSVREVSFTTETEYDDRGLPVKVSKVDLSNQPKQQTTTTYYGHTVTTPAIERSRPKKTESGLTGSIDVSTSFQYAETPNGGEKITVTDDQRKIVSETELDAQGRAISSIVTDANGTVLRKEKYGYDAAGRLAYTSRQQSGVGKVETFTTYDAMGRAVSQSMTGASVNGAATTLTTATAYDFNGHTITETGPSAGTPGPSTITTIDTLGRPKTVERKGSGGEVVRVISAYDLGGAASYQSDGVRNARLTRNDALGRPVYSVDAAGIGTETRWDAWDQPLQTNLFDADQKAIARTRNFFTEFGRLRSTNVEVDSNGRALAMYNTWDSADTARGTRVGMVAGLLTQQPANAVRVTQEYFDASGRPVTTLFGGEFGNSTVPSGNAVFNRTDYTYGKGGTVPTAFTSLEPRSGASTTTTTDFDGLDRPVSVTVEGATDSTRTTYDEAGNALTVDAMGMDPSSSTYDSRGLMVTSTHPGGGTITSTYDALGVMTAYKDENDVSTRYKTDGLGRVTKVEYPDGTTEETTYEKDTGMVLATKDRAGQWLAYNYGVSGRLLSVHIGADTSQPKLTEYEYDAGGRVKLVRNKDAAIEYEGFDQLGRPTTTRTIRYAGGSGFANAPVVLDVHTQTHTWTVFDGERESWRMPVAGRTAGSKVPGSRWMQTITEVRDAGSNLLQLQDEGKDLLTAESRAAAKLKSRSRTIVVPSTTANPIPPGQPLQTEYAYTGDAGITGMKSFSIARAASTIAGMKVGGSANVRDAADRLQKVTDLGLDQRMSEWRYDARGRLERSWLNVAAVGARPPTVDTYSTTDFRQKRDIAPLLSPSQHQVLGLANAVTIEPLSWAATAKSASRLDQRSSSLDGQVQSTRTYTFDGGRRTGDGTWESQFDELGRLVAITNVRGGRRIEYKWDPNDRIVGRIALKASIAGGYETENRFSILQADGLPARTTFVWDPVVDRLVAIFEEGRSIDPDGNPVLPDVGLVRQYLHGDGGMDDPVRVVVSDDTGIHAYLPLFDEAGTGSLQTVIDAYTGNIIERVLYADAYGDAPRYLQGPVVDAIDVEAKKTDDNKLEKVTVRVHLTEIIDEASVSGGVRLGAITAAKLMVRPTLAVPKRGDDGSTITWELTADEWKSMSGAGEALEIAVRDTLRFTNWGATTSVSNAPAWAVKVYGVLAEPDAPVIARQSFASLQSFIDAIPAKETKKTDVYAVADLYLAAGSESKTRLLTGFKAAPFIEPATGIAYFRARWYDPATGTWLTPDPAGYGDSSNLYAAFRNDPVNLVDPNGDIAFVPIMAAGAVIGGSLNVVRQLIQMQEDPRKRAEGFSWSELGASVLAGAVLAPVLAVVPELAAPLALHGAYQGYENIQQGNIATGSFDMATSLLPFAFKSVQSATFGKGTAYSNWVGRGPMESFSMRLSRFTLMPLQRDAEIGVGYSGNEAATARHGAVIIGNEGGGFTFFDKTFTVAEGVRYLARIQELPYKDPSYGGHPYKYETIRVTRAAADEALSYARVRKVPDPVTPELFIKKTANCSHFVDNVLGKAGLPKIGTDSRADTLFYNFINYRNRIPMVRTTGYASPFIGSANLGNLANPRQQK